MNDLIIPEVLPPIEVRGRAIIETSNLEEFEAHLDNMLAGLPTDDPTTDDRLAAAKQTVKTLKETEDSLERARKALLAESVDMQAVMDTIERCREKCAGMRTGTQKRIDKAREAKRVKIIDDGLRTLTCPAEIREKLRDGMQAVTMNKRTEATMLDAVANYVVSLNNRFAQCEAVIFEHRSTHGEADTNDEHHLYAMGIPELLQELDRRRLTRTERERNRAEVSRAVEVLVSLPEPVKPAAPVAMPTETEEWETYKSAVFAAFAAVKEARETLAHRSNQDRAEVFAMGCKDAWKEVAR